MKALSIDHTATIISELDIDITYRTLRKMQTFLRESKPERLSSQEGDVTAWKSNVSERYAHESMSYTVSAAIQIANMIRFHPDMKES